MNRALPEYFKLEPERVSELRVDAKLKRDGAVLYFVTDVHDLAKYCFPIDPMAPEGRTPISHIADDQAALFEVFTRRQPEPVLPQEYEGELERNHRSIAKSTDFAYTRAQAIQELARHVESHPDLSLPDEALNELRGDFNVVLAVTTGIYSIGLDRWIDVRTRLKLESGFAWSMHAQVAQAFLSYRPTSLCKEIEDKLVGMIPARLPTRTARFRRERAAENDARVVDKVLHVNHCLEQARKDEKLERRHIFLYFSSAPRTESIFKMPQVQDALPKIDHHLFSPWRTKTQVFLSMILKPGKPDEDEKNDLSAQIENLENFEQLLKDSRKDSRMDLRKTKHPGATEDKCLDCVLDGGRGSGECSYYELCRMIKDKSKRYLEKDTTFFPNLGLLSNIERYSEFSKKQSPDPSGEEVRKLFLSLRQSEIPEMALERRWLVQQSMLFNSLLLQTAPQELGKEEVITSAMQVLPFAVRIDAVEYRAIVKHIVDFYQLPQNKLDAKQAVLSRIYESFNPLDREIKSFNPEHELVRSLIQLSFEGGKRTGSLQLIQNALQRWQEEKGESRWGTEFRYVLIWALRLHHRYVECDERAREALNEAPNDARLHHGLLLNCYESFERHVGEYTVPKLIDRAKRTKDLYAQSGNDYRESLSTPDMVDGLIAVIFNDLAYLSCFMDPPENLSASREYLAELRFYVPEQEWSERFPEYLHTEATLLCREAKATQSMGKLLEADSKLKLALKNRTTNRFIELQNEIDRLRIDLQGGSQP